MAFRRITKSVPWMDGWHADRLKYGPTGPTNPYNVNTQRFSHGQWETGRMARVNWKSDGLLTRAQVEMLDLEWGQ